MRGRPPFHFYRFFRRALACGAASPGDVSSMCESWITGFASSFRHISSTEALALAGDRSAMSISKTLIDRTAETDEKPKSFRAFSTFSPSGSATPFLRWISTRARTVSPRAD